MKDARIAKLLKYGAVAAKAEKVQIVKEMCWISNRFVEEAGIEEYGQGKQDKEIPTWV